VFLVGALDPTIRDEQDLCRVRITYLGSVPAINADTVNNV